MSQYPIIAVPESVDVLLGVLHHLLELVGAGDLGRRLEVGPGVHCTYEVRTNWRQQIYMGTQKGLYLGSASNVLLGQQIAIIAAQQPGELSKS